MSDDRDAVPAARFPILLVLRFRLDHDWTQNFCCLMSQKDCIAELAVTRVCRQVARPHMEMMLVSALVISIVGCVVGYSVRSDITNGPSSEPRRRRPF